MAGMAKAYDKIMNMARELGYEPLFIQNERMAHLKEWTIKVTLEKDNVWVNGVGEEMKWNRDLFVYHNKRGYYLGEKTGYALGHTHCASSKVDTIIDVMRARLEEWKNGNA